MTHLKKKDKLAIQVRIRYLVTLQRLGGIVNKRERERERERENLVPRLKMHGAFPPFPYYDFMAFRLITHNDKICYLRLPSRSGCELRSSGMLTQRIVVIPYRRFGITYRSRNVGSPFYEQGIYVGSPQEFCYLKRSGSFL